MAYIATLRILIDEPNESRVTDGLNEMMRTAQEPVEEGNPAWIIDWAIDAITPVNDTLADAITNETYKEGDAF